MTWIGPWVQKYGREGWRWTDARPADVTGSKGVFLMVSKSCMQHLTMHNAYIYRACKMWPNLFNSPWASTSSIWATASMSSSWTRLRRLQDPRHKRAHVDTTESWLRMCDKRRWLQLKSRSTSTDVAMGKMSIQQKHTWDDTTDLELSDNPVPFDKAVGRFCTSRTITEWHPSHVWVQYWGTRLVHRKGWCCEWGPALGDC
jgi:hypothetical protein